VQELAASFANQALESQALRAELSDILGEIGFPQTFLRIGHPVASVPATPRRDVDELFEGGLLRSDKTVTGGPLPRGGSSPAK
jgi:hypothetical protein